MTEPMTTSQAAQRLGVTVQTVRVLVRAGDLHGHRNGREWLIDPASVEALCHGWRPPFLHVGDAAGILRVTSRTVERLAGDGLVPSVTFGKQYRFPRSPLVLLARQVGGPVTRRALRRLAPTPQPRAVDVELTGAEQRVLAAVRGYRGDQPLLPYLVEVCGLPCPDTARFVLLALAEKGVVGRGIAA